MEWEDTSSPKKPRKCLQTFSARKIMANGFWDREGVLLVDFLERCSTINSERYCETQKNLKRAIQNKRRGKLSSEVLFLNDNARPHKANRTPELLDHFGWEVFDHFRCTVRILRRATTTCFQT